MTEQGLRELDRHIADRIADWKCPTCVNGMHKKHGPAEYAKMLNWFIREGSPASNWPLKEPDIMCDHWPHYSTNRTASQEVLERCLSRKLIGDTIISNDGDYWLRVSVGHGDVVEASAPTLPLAIALFAKKLFGKE